MLAVVTATSSLYHDSTFIFFTRTPFVLGVVHLIDDAGGDTSVERRLGRGERALVGAGRLGIVKGMF